MLQRIEQQDSTDSVYGMKIIQWVLFTKEPLSLRGLLYAIAIQPGMKDLDVIRDLPPRSIVDVTLGLVTVDHQWGDEFVRFVHLTFQEHLLQKWNIHFPSGHSLLAETTLTYLNFNAMSDNKARYHRGDLSPFFDYAARNWGHHVREQEDENVFLLAVSFLQGGNFQNMDTVRRYCFQHQDEFNRGHSCLHEAALFGLANILHILLQQCVNSTDLNGQRLSSCTASKGQITTNQPPLEDIGIHCDLPDVGGRTPITYAIMGGHQDIVCLLLGYGANLDSASTDKRTPLSYAAEFGRTDVIRLLLEQKDINPNSPDSRGRTPFSYAAGRGRIDVVRLLLEHQSVDFTSRDNKGKTPLSYAARSGHVEVTRLLLEQINIDFISGDDEGSTLR